VELVADDRGVPGPADVLRGGNVDASALLVLWLLRRSFWTLVGIGVIVLIRSGGLDAVGELETSAIASVAEAQEVIRSPRALLILAPAARLASGWFALLLAFPLARRFQRQADRETRRTGWHPAAWSDRWHLVKALRDWRWTSSVRRLARQRLGRAGPPLLVLDIALLISGVVMLPVALVSVLTGLA
jgi:hypothetical protein